MGYQSTLEVYGGEIAHGRYMCEAGHEWERTQLGFDVWGWTYRGEIQALIEAREVAG